MSLQAARWTAALIVAVVVGCNQGPDGAPGVNAAALKPAGVECAGGKGCADCPNGKGCGGGHAVPSGASKEVYRVPIDGSPRLGPDDALVTLVEFTDYQCPFCSRADETVRKLVEEYGAKLRVVVKHQPLPFHTTADVAARAAAAADQQGKFWAFHRALFAVNGKTDDLEGLAKGAGLDVVAFRSALADPRAASVVERDKQLAAAVGARGTPTFFINGRKLTGAQPIERFRAAIDEEIARAEGLLQKGVARGAVYDELMKTALAAAAPERTAAAGAAAERAKIDLGSAPVKGPASAPVTIVVFSDFECPFCARGANVMKEIEQKYAGKVRFAFKHQPLPFHKQARLAAAAAIAAGEQGRFWEMHDAVFAKQAELDRDSLVKRAGELGLDVGRFTRALDASDVERRIAADQEEARALGAEGTPTFFINGRRLIGAQPFAAFAAAIDEELKNR